MTAFWHEQLAGQPDIPGPWKAAFCYPSIQSLYVHATATRALLVQITPVVGAPFPTAAA